jgi:hypothetical protein
MKSTFSLIIKGILLYFTLIYWLFFLVTADSYRIIPLIIIYGVGFSLIFLCKNIISKEDLIKLTRITKEDLDETV